MKFNLLPIGARFEYEGEVWVKAGPLSADRASGGGRRMIPRSAILKPLDGVAVAEPAVPAAAVEPAVALAAVDAVAERCAGLLERLAPQLEPAALAAAREELAAARQEAAARLLAGGGQA